MKKLLSVFLVLVLLAVAAAGFVFFDYTGDVKGGKGDSEKITVSVAKGSGANAVAGVLAENGIVKNEIYFKLYAKQNPIDNLQYGDFILSADMSYEDIVKELTTVKDMRETVSITVFEGSTIIKISKIVEAAGFCTAQEFIDVVENTDWSQFKFYQYVEDDVNKPFKMEGFLYPETYDFYPEATAYEIAEKMLGHFDSLITDEMYAQMAQQGFTLQDVVTVASYVEEEAGDPINQPDVAAVFLNRLKEGSPFPKMESDVSYYYMREQIEPYLGVGRDQSPVEMQQAVNTYLCEGIPVTPVSSPSITAIQAVLNPTPDSPYYFFLTDLTGKYYYAETWEGHTQNIATMKAVNATVEK
ncbi:MAG: endolytic transglycosylase MltG [Oscillospiraceae bacterium]|nr:endolytic transglycosylase MltG [Oscillospiraceae bacterium]